MKRWRQKYKARIITILLRYYVIELIDKESQEKAIDNATGKALNLEKKKIII